LEHGAPVSWPNVRDAVARLAARGTLAATGPRTKPLAADCRHHLGTDSPRTHRAAIGVGQGEHPTVGQACLLLAAMCAPPPKPAAKPAARPAAKAPAKPTPSPAPTPTPSQP
jgi:hypothetical protein